MDKRKLGSYYNEVRSELEEKLQITKSIFENISSVHDSVKNNKDSIESLLEEAQSVLGDINNKSNELAKQLTNIDTLRAQANDPEKGLKVTIDEIADCRNEVARFRDGIVKLSNSSKRQSGEVAKFKDAANQVYKKLLGIKDESNRTFKDIEKFYQLAADTGLAGSFDQRKEQLKRSASIWFCVLIGSTIILSAFWGLFVYRLSIMTFTAERSSLK